MAKSDRTYEIGRADRDWVESIAEPIHPALAAIEAAAEPERIPILDRESGRVLAVLAAGRRRICEIGTAHGNLTANLLRNCAAATVVTVNAPRESQSGVLVTYELTEDEIGRVYRRHGYDQRVIQLIVNSVDLNLRPHVRDGAIDLAVVDGCHDTAFVLNDFEKVRPFIRAGGVVLFHDTHPSQSGHLSGSYRACLLLRRRGFDVKWIEGTWWGYWQRAPLARSR